MLRLIAPVAVICFVFSFGFAQYTTNKQESRQYIIKAGEIAIVGLKNVSSQGQVDMIINAYHFDVDCPIPKFFEPQKPGEVPCDFLEGGCEPFDPEPQSPPGFDEPEAFTDLSFPINDSEFLFQIYVVKSPEENSLLQEGYGNQSYTITGGELQPWNAEGGWFAVVYVVNESNYSANAIIDIGYNTDLSEPSTAAPGTIEN